MFVIIALLSIFTFSRTISYGIFEIKKNSNKLGRNMPYCYFFYNINSSFYNGIY